MERPMGIIKTSERCPPEDMARMEPRITKMGRAAWAMI
jgi:hypothetical protein